MRNVVVTGASKGIGFEIAKAFLNHGDKVLICSRNSDHLSESLSILQGSSDHIEIFKCDMADNETVRAFATYILNDFGGCDILVNNAGIFIPGSVHNEKEGNFELMMKVNIESAYTLTRLLTPSMKEKQKGDIVNICSIASQTAYANGGSYSISKYAMLGFSKNLREELKPEGIRVISILPGATYTDSWSGSDIDENRLMPADDIAELVLTACNLSRRTVVEEIVVRPQLGDL